MRSHAFAVFAAGAVLLAGCSGSSSDTSSSAAPSPTGGLTAEQAAFCHAVTDWGQDPAAQEVRDASKNGDVAGVIKGFKDWAASTEAMAEAVPADAPAATKQAFARLNDSVQTIATSGTQTPKQARAYARSQGEVLSYYQQTCSG